ncbi:MAG: BrnT family toxin [Proteobacteria bacterium]|nr:BrnT family toxin [Pseudomonadota bacterium]
MFEWDEAKRQATIEKHGFDFVEATEVLIAPHVLLETRSEQEIRQIAIGPLGKDLVAVVFTRRFENFRLITVRKARRREREYYQTLHPGTNPGDEKPH